MAIENWKCLNCAAFNHPRRTACWKCGCNWQSRAHSSNQTTRRSKKPSSLHLLLGAITIAALVAGAFIVVSPGTIRAATVAPPPTQIPQQSTESSTLLDVALSPSSDQTLAKPDQANLTADTSVNSDGITGSDANSAFNPPIVGQGGTCISGSIIDKYEQPRGGATWVITIKKIRPTVENPITTTAGANGQFLFSNLSAGTYTVELIEPEGWRPYTPDKFEVTLSGIGSDCAQVRFKKEALACLIVTKLDNGGNQDFRTKIGLPGWKITASNAKENVSREQVTDGKGVAFFPNLPPGDWIVQEEVRVGWAPSLGYPDRVAIELESPRMPGTCQSLTFVNHQIGDDGFILVKKEDIRGAPVPDWSFLLVRPDGTQPSKRGITNNLGQLYFLNLTLGEWKVIEETRDPWWKLISPTEEIIVLDQPGAGKQVTFVNEPLGCIDGYKINHLEEGLGGWQIIARNASTGEELTQVTNSNGYFQFVLSLGTWVMSEVMQDGWTAVTPAEFTVTVTRPFECEHVRFKNRTNFACLDVYKKDSYDNAGLPSWLITLKPAYGGVALTGLTDGTGWVRFNELASGDYIVSETPQVGWVPVSPASSAITLIANGTCSVFTFYNRQPDNLPVFSDPPTASGACVSRYTVQSGDTLFRIALRFGVTVRELQGANRIADPSLIHPGTALCIP